MGVVPSAPASQIAMDLCAVEIMSAGRGEMKHFIGMGPGAIATGCSYRSVKRTMDECSMWVATICSAIP